MMVSKKGKPPQEERNVVVERLTLLLHIQKVPVSNLDPEDRLY
jgi:hypothetical protein